MAYPFEVTPDEIDTLNERRLQTLVNRLVEIEVSQEGLPVDVLVASDRIHDKDGGIDARIRAPGFDGSEFLPDGSSIWQAKAAKSTWPDYRAELSKSRVREAIENCHTYVIVLARQVNDQQHETQSHNLKAALDEIRPNASFMIRSASQVAKWATKYPAVWHLLGRPPTPFWGVSDFLAQQELHNVQYEWSDPTESLRDALRKQILHPSSARPLRISGMTGVGKSRLVLETFAEPSSNAVYVPNAEHLTIEVLTWMRDRPGLSVTLVVDECSLPEVERIQTYVSSAKGNLRLVTTGIDPPPDRLNHFVVGPMTDDVIRKVVSGVYPQITLDQREWIVDKVRGFVKLARRLAEVARRKEINLSELDVPQLLGEMFNAEERDSLTVVALLSDVGWEGEVSGEGQTLSEHMDVEWRSCRRIIQEMEQRGYVGRRGRYRHVTPELLAIWFSAEEWRSNHEDLLAIFNQAPPEMADRMSNRFRQMPHVDEVVEVAREVLGPAGPFRSLSVLNHPRNARLFGDLSRLEPEAAVAALDAVFSQLNVASVRSFDAGRREIVWTLERLVARRDLFPRAARLLVRLALAESEHFANNATGVFQSVFHPTSGVTAATGDERLQFLAEVLNSSDELEVNIAIGALKRIFDIHGSHAISPDPGGQPPPAPWVPAANEERAAYFRRAFALLEALLDHDSSEVREAAESVILVQFRSLFWLGLGAEALVLADRTDLPESIRRRLALKIDNVIIYDRDKAFMNDKLMARLTSLRRTMFSYPLRERLQVRLGSWNHDLIRKARETSESSVDLEVSELKDLASDLLQQPDLLHEEFDWICSEEAVNGRPFLTFLAEQDRHREWLNPVLEAALTLKQPDLIAAYVLGISLAGDREGADGLLDEWSGIKDMQHLVAPVTASLGLTERRAGRLLRLHYQGSDPRSLLRLELARCESDLTLKTLSELLRVMAASGPPLVGTVWSILSHLQGPNVEVAWISEPAFLNLLWELVGGDELIGDFGESHASYSWAECAKLLVEDDPNRLASAIIRAVRSEREHLYASSYVRQVLDACFTADPLAVWTALAAAVEETTIGGWLLMSWAAESDVVEKIGLDYLKLWVEQDNSGFDARIKLIAQLTNVGTELSPVIRWLVEQHGDSDGLMLHLETQLGTRVSWGGWADIEGPRLEAARKWTQDEHPAIRMWARRLVEKLEPIVREYRQMDDEADLRH